MIPLFFGLGVAHGGNSSSSSSASSSSSVAINSNNTIHNYTPPGQGARLFTATAATTNDELGQLSMSPIQRAIFGMYSQSSNYLADMMGVPRSEDAALSPQAQPAAPSASSNGSQSLDPHQQLAQMMAYRTVLGSLANNMNGLFSLAYRDDQLTMNEQLSSWSEQMAQRFNSGSGQNQSQNIPSAPNFSMLGQMPLYSISTPTELSSIGSSNFGSYNSTSGYGGFGSLQSRLNELTGNRFS